MTDSSSNDALTADDIAFLRRPLHGFLSVAGGPNPPQPRPVWFEPTADGSIQLFTGPDSLHVRRLTRDPRASIVVAAPATERERWISVSGPASIEAGGAHELCERLAALYWDLEDPVRANDLKVMLGEAEWVRLVIRPEQVRRYAG